MPRPTNETPAGHGEPLFDALLKREPADFVVNECLDIAFDGTGEHLYLLVEKCGVNTDYLVKLIETAYAVNSADIGVAGLKDRHAMTRQWISVRTPLGEEPFEATAAHFNDATAIDREPGSERLALRGQARHTRKLRRGAHRGNDFVVTLHDVLDSRSSAEDRGLKTAVADRITRLNSDGFPNFIGPQRFGHGGQNLVRARQWFRQPKRRTSRQQRSLWLSAARSALFNTVCAERVSEGTWTHLIEGEPPVLDGSRSFFNPVEQQSSDQELVSRCTDFDIHPSAPWWGRGPVLSQGACAQLECRVLAGYADLCGGLESAGLTQERRALRARAQDLQYSWADERTLELRFHLSRGVFATTLLGELGICREPVRDTRTS